MNWDLGKVTTLLARVRAVVVQFLLEPSSRGKLLQRNQYGWSLAHGGDFSAAGAWRRLLRRPRGVWAHPARQLAAAALAAAILAAAALAASATQ